MSRMDQHLGMQLLCALASSLTRQHQSLTPGGRDGDLTSAFKTIIDVHNCTLTAIDDKLIKE